MPRPVLSSMQPSDLSKRTVASGHGHVEVNFGGHYRDVYYARYLDWLITTPLLLVDVLLIAKLPTSSWFFAIFADVAMVLTGLFGGLVTENYRSGALRSKLRPLLHCMHALGYLTRGQLRESGLLAVLQAFSHCTPAPSADPHGTPTQLCCPAAYCNRCHVTWSGRRWGWFLVACVFMAAIFVIIGVDGQKYVEARDSSISGFYQTLVLTLVILWSFYPLVSSPPFPWLRSMSSCLRVCSWQS